MKELSNQMIGIAGVYYVAAELSRRDYISLITTRNTAGIDMVVVNQKTANAISVQVKSSYAEVNYWLVGKKEFENKDNNVVYVFVVLPTSEKDRPKFWIAHARDLKFKKETSKTGSVWYYTPKDDKFLDNWGVFERETK